MVIRGPGFGVTVHEDALLEPLGWKRSRKVFVNSMSDIAHARVPASFVARVFAVMALSPQHSFQVLTFSDHLKINFYCDLLFHVADMSPRAARVAPLPAGTATARRRERWLPPACGAVSSVCP